MSDIIKGKVINVIDKYRIVVNIGSLDGVTNDNRFLVYRLGDELFDPDTRESLGVLEIVCGEGTPEHIQERMTTLRTAKRKVTKSKTIVKRGPFFGDTEETYDPETYDVPFDNVDTNCLVKQIK